MRSPRSVSMPSWWSLCLVLSLAACQCGPAAVPPENLQSGDAGAQDDAGATLDDGGATADDAGVSDPDAGPDDGGLLPDPDGGLIDPDGGLLDPDGGTSPADAGIVDAGLLLLVSTTPAVGGVLQTTATATFSLPLDAASVTASSVRLLHRGAPVQAVLTQPTPTSVTLTPPLLPLRTALEWELTSGLTSGVEVFAGARLALSTRDGQWDTSGRLITPNLDIEAQLAAGGPRRHYAVWISNNAVIRAAHLEPTSLQPNRWQDDGILTTATAVPSEPQLAVNRNDVGLAVWLQTVAGERSVVAARMRRVDPTQAPTWSAPEVLETSTANANEPQAGVDDAGNLFVVWTQLEGARVNVLLNRYDVALGQWSGPQPLQSTTSAVSNARLAVSGNGTALVAFLHADSTSVRVTGSTLTSGWSMPLPLELGATGAPTLALNAAGDALVAWTANGEVHASDYTAATALWSAPWSLGNGSVPQAAMTATRAAVVFILAGNNNTHVWAALRTAGAWTTSRLTTGNVQGVGNLLRLVASDEHFAAAWQQSTGVVVRRAAADNAGWLQATTAVPGATRPSLATDPWGLITVVGQSGTPSQLSFNGFW